MAVEEGLGNILESLDVVSPKHVVEYYPRTRDRDDIRVLRCQRSGVIFLSHAVTRGTGYYEEKAVHNNGVTVKTKTARGVITTAPNDDSIRRQRDFAPYIRDKDWVDIGSGRGDIVRLLRPIAKRAVAVEPNRQHLATMLKCGVDAYQSLESIGDARFDVVTLFHVFEHFPDPLGELRRIAAIMRAGGRIIIEVPHAKDFLLETLGLEAFKAFTFWSEHLVLHTRESLQRVMEAAGFDVLSIEGVQRYGFVNHLYWLRHKKPGGHVLWPQLQDERLNVEYERLLKKLDQTDTIVLMARNQKK